MITDDRGYPTCLWIDRQHGSKSLLSEPCRTKQQAVDLLVKYREQERGAGGRLKLFHVVMTEYEQT